MRDVPRGVARPAATAPATPRGLVVPAYFHPAVAAPDWRALAEAGRSVQAVVLNAADGPGAAPEPELTAAALATGRPVYGYVDTDYGRRPAADIHRDLGRWYAGYPVCGVFLDRVATAVTLLPFYAGLVGRARRCGAATVVLNHGAHPHPGYADLGDALVTFEGPYAAHRRLDPPAWTRSAPPGRFWHLVHATPRRRLAETLDRAARAGVTGVFVTDRSGVNPWDGLPSYFPELAGEWTGRPATSRPAGIAAMMGHTDVEEGPWAAIRPSPPGGRPARAATPRRPGGASPRTSR